MQESSGLKQENPKGYLNRNTKPKVAHSEGRATGTMSWRASLAPATTGNVPAAYITFENIKHVWS